MENTTNFLGHTRATFSEMMDKYPDKFLLFYDMKDDPDGYARGYFKGAYQTAKDRSEALKEIPEELHGVLGMTEGWDFFTGGLGGLL